MSTIFFLKLGLAKNGVLAVGGQGSGRGKRTSSINLAPSDTIIVFAYILCMHAHCKVITKFVLWLFQNTISWRKWDCFARLCCIHLLPYSARHTWHKVGLLLETAVPENYHCYWWYCVFCSADYNIHGVLLSSANNLNVRRTLPSAVFVFTERMNCCTTVGKPFILRMYKQLMITLQDICMLINFTLANLHVQWWNCSIWCFSIGYSSMQLHDCPVPLWSTLTQQKFLDNL